MACDSSLCTELSGARWRVSSSTGDVANTTTPTIALNRDVSAAAKALQDSRRVLIANIRLDQQLRVIMVGEELHAVNRGRHLDERVPRPRQR